MSLSNCKRAEYGEVENNVAASVTVEFKSAKSAECGNEDDWEIKAKRSITQKAYNGQKKKIKKREENKESAPCTANHKNQ